MAGSLFVVATPIGNLEDLTLRGRRILGEVDLIAAEDTRRTSRLLAHCGITKPLVSLHEHNERREAPRLVERMRAGESVALVSDAGTPAISDPGTWLVRLAREAGLVVTPIPGPSAITAALSISGLPATPFTFLGFPPSSGKAREEWFEELAATPWTVVLFEAPHRVRRTSEELRQKCGERPIIVNREISKIHEDSVISQIDVATEAGEIPERGEFVIVVGPAVTRPESAVDHKTALRLFDQIRASSSIPDTQVETAVGAVLSLKPAKVRRLVKEARIAAKRAQRD